MKIPMFEQTIREMMGSKTNYVGVAAVVLGLWTYLKGGDGSAMVVLGLGLLGVKDAVVKAGK